MLHTTEFKNRVILNVYSRHMLYNTGWLNDIRVGRYSNKLFNLNLNTILFDYIFLELFK